MGAYRPDRHGIADMVADVELLGPTMRSTASKIAEQARATAPYDPESSDHFRDHFHAGVEVDDVLSARGPHKAVVGVAWNDDDVALSIETGTSRTPAHNTLTNAMFAVAEEGI